VESLNVLVTSVIGEECLQQIAQVSPRIKLTDVSGLLRAENGGDFTSKEKLDVLLADAEVIFGLRLPQNVIGRASELKWVQVMSAGVNRFLDSEMVESPVILTNVSGIHATPIGEFVLGLMLMFAKNAPLHFQLKARETVEAASPVDITLKNGGNCRAG